MGTVRLERQLFRMRDRKQACHGSNLGKAHFCHVTAFSVMMPCERGEFSVTSCMRLGSSDMKCPREKPTLYNNVRNTGEWRHFAANKSLYLASQKAIPVD